MNEHNATEQAYKHGYAKGRADAMKELAEMLQEVAYDGYSGRATPEYVFVSVEQINNLVQEMRDEE
jgi:hypothetical protein